ncbi:MAG: WbqC family protein [Anaerolineales bacterium]|nr:WbqC family protein [Anaerolineales bacterium]
MHLKKFIAVMQPYLFPYIGYFHLIDASHLFVFYDDVNYITNGWINRNRILLNGKDFLFTVPISKASQNCLVNETALAINDSWKKKFQQTMRQAYGKAPYFSQVESLVCDAFAQDYDSVSDLAIRSVVNVYQYLNLPFNYVKSSVCSPETKGIGKAERLIAIAKQQGYHSYVNAAGGKALYDKEFFRNHGIELGFIESASVQYKQFSNPFVPSLSIIDVLMFNDPKSVQTLLKSYAII